MSTEEARYYRASRTARAAWEATQPQLTLGLEAGDCDSARYARASWESRPTASPASSPGLDDGPLTADGSRAAHRDPSSGKADGGHHRTQGGLTPGGRIGNERSSRRPIPNPPGVSPSGFELTTMGVDANSPEGTSVHPQKGH